MTKNQAPVLRTIIVILLLALPSLMLVSCSAGGPAGRDETAATEPVVLFSIGMHIEPVKGYNNPELYETHAAAVRSVADIVAAHDGRMNIQAQTPFTAVAVENGDTLLSDLAGDGHELGLHFHEDAHLGKDSESLPAAAWCSAMRDEAGLIEAAGGVDNVRYWSGGNLYPDLLEAAACAGFDIYGDWKNPETQETPAELGGVNPWRPSGGVVPAGESPLTDAAGSTGAAVDVTALTKHDPSGAILYLPDGLSGRESATRPPSLKRDEQAYFDYLEGQLREALGAAAPDRVNVFHFNVHPGEFVDGPGRQAGAAAGAAEAHTAAKYAALESFLTEVVDPLVADGRLQWATYSQVADAYGQREAAGGGYMTFAVNVHDVVNVDDSADTILRLADIYEKYGVRGDFYLTAPVVHLYEEQRPDVIQRLRDSDMTISYHVRPPHALYNRFDQRLEGLDDARLAQTLLDYESYRLDLATGGLLRDEPGGYRYVADTFGRDPVVAPSPNNDPRIKSLSRRTYAGLGAQMTITYHEQGTDPDEPFEWVDGLLVRPSDFSITRWGDPGSNGKGTFWWNKVLSDEADAYDPAGYLQAQLKEWWSAEAGRAPFVTSLIHENNFYRSGAAPWSSRYFSDNGKTLPLEPPFDLNAEDASTPRSLEEQEAIWAAYEEMVAYAAANLNVVTSEDIVRLASGGQESPDDLR